MVRWEQKPVEGTSLTRVLIANDKQVALVALPGDADYIVTALNRYEAIKKLTEERFDLSRLLKDVIPIELPAPAALD